MQNKGIAGNKKDENVLSVEVHLFWIFEAWLIEFFTDTGSDKSILRSVYQFHFPKICYPVPLRYFSLFLLLVLEEEIMKYIYYNEKMMAFSTKFRENWILEFLTTGCENWRLVILVWRKAKISTHESDYLLWLKEN